MDNFNLIIDFIEMKISTFIYSLLGLTLKIIDCKQWLY